MLNPVIRSKVDALWDKFWSGGIANPLLAIEQISYLLFMRRLEAMDQTAEQRARFLKRPFDSLFAGRFKGLNGQSVDKKKLRWSEFKNMAAEEALDHVRDFVFPFIKNLGNDSFSVAMKDAVFIIPKAGLLVEAMHVIDDIYAEIEREQKEGQVHQDVQGDLYEYLLSEIASAGKNGQFRTPRHIIQMICGLVNPELQGQICDPACGTGGFLLGAYQHILTKYTSPKQRVKNEDGLEIGLVGDKLTNDRQWEVLRKSLHGFDFDTSMVRIAQMNLMLHGIQNPNVAYMDTLSKRFEEKNRYQVVLANPPFKGNLDKGDLNEELTLESTKTELLFVDRILSLLDTGGRAGVIVPTGVLFGSSKAHVALRKRLLEDSELQAVVSMPSGVFRPYAGVSTAVLVFVKGGETEEVWFYDMQADGRSLDDKRVKVEANDIPDLLARWPKRDPKKDTDRTAKCFFVPLKEIVENKYDLSINRYKEIKAETVHYDPPKVILKKLKKLEAEILEGLEALEGMVG
jgi:type I restriction enzyme M protein